MTLIEVLVTVSLLGFVMASTLTLYSNIMQTNRQRDALTAMISDADRILSTVEHDIRNAASFMTTYALEDKYTVIAALPRNKNATNRPQTTVVYALDADRPKRLFRVVVGDDVHATELSAGVKSFSMIPTPDALITVELNLETIVAGEVKTWQASSAFGLE
jgi:type II secretory pathway pseudopilin PulG